MPKSPHTPMENASESGTSGGLGKQSPKESMPLGASTNLSKNTTATTLKGSRKTLTSAELEALQSKIGLVAGALADFQTAGGLVAVLEMPTKLASGRMVRAVKILLVVNGAKIIKKRTADGVEFDLVAE